ncbi:MAG: MNIO family bufferin maturase [Geminicoccaceae bacterium]
MRCQDAIPLRAGVGLKAEHYEAILRSRPDIGWFEIHAENYMGEGGPPHHFLEAIRELYPISLHGVGLSIGADGPLDQDHLQRLKALNQRYRPGLFSEHLAWSTHEGVYINDLLPVPYTEETVARVSDHINEVQDVVGRRMLLENPSTYLTFADSTMSEIRFLELVSEKTECGLLLDVNNVFVSAINHGFVPEDYIDAFPLELVGEIHLGGHADDRDDEGNRLLIDAHDRPIDDPVWALYAHTIEKGGKRPTLVEWDTNVPAWAQLLSEAVRAETVLGRLHDARDDALAH